MSKLGDMPVPLALTRDQVRMLRFALKLADTTPPLWWDYSASRGLTTALDTAETQATIEHARSPQEVRERAEIARIYGPDLVDAVLKRDHGGNDVWRSPR